MINRLYKLSTRLHQQSAEMSEMLFSIWWRLFSQMNESLHANSIGRTEDCCLDVKIVSSDNVEPELVHTETVNLLCGE